MSSGIVRVNQKELKDKPHARWLIKKVRGKTYTIKCLSKRKHFGHRLICGICGKAVETLYMPSDREKFGCKQCYRSHRYFESSMRNAMRGMLTKIRQWGKKTY